MLYIPDSQRPYSIDFVDKFVCYLAGVDFDNFNEKQKLLSILNNVTTYSIERSARIAYNDFCLDRLLLVLQIEKIMNIKPDYSLSTDIYNTLENSDYRGMKLHFINHWSNLKQNPTLNSFILYIKSLLLRFKNSGIIDNYYSKILSFTGSQFSGRDDKQALLKNQCKNIGMIYKNIQLRYGKQAGKWISQITESEDSVEKCVLDYYRQIGWNGIRFNKSTLNKLLNDDNYCINCCFPYLELRTKLSNTFTDTIDSYSRGLPDLILWKDKNIAYCEVKEPHDSIKKEQISVAHKIITSNNNLYYLVHVIGLFE